MFSPTQITFCACACNSGPRKRGKSWIRSLHSDLSYAQTHGAGRRTKSRVHGAGATDAEAAYNLSFRGVRTNPPNPPWLRACIVLYANSVCLGQHADLSSDHPLLWIGPLRLHPCQSVMAIPLQKSYPIFNKYTLHIGTHTHTQHFFMDYF